MIVCNEYLCEALTAVLSTGKMPVPVIALMAGPVEAFGVGCLLFGLGVPPLVLRGVLVCCFCFAVWWLPSPAGCCLPLPLRRPCGVVGRATFLTVADRLPVAVRFPAGPQVSLKVW